MIEINYTLFLQLTSFIIFLWIMSKVVYYPVRTFLRERESRNKELVEAASQDRSESASLKTNYRTMISDAQQQSLALQRELVKKTEDDAAQIVAQARKEQDAKLAQAKNALAEEKEAAKAKLQEEVERIADTIVERVT